MVRYFFCAAAMGIALSCSTFQTALAATLGFTTQNPAIISSSAAIDYLEFGGDGDLSTFGAEVDIFNGITAVGLTELSFGVGFLLANPTAGPSGGFDIFDENGLFLEGSLVGLGFTENVMELQFSVLGGSAAGAFGTSVLALIAFDDALGTHPFNDLVDGGLYSASVSLSSVVLVSEPATLSLLAFGLGCLGVARSRGAPRRAWRQARVNKGATTLLSGGRPGFLNLSS